MYLWHDGQNIAPPVLLQDDLNVHPRLTVDLTREEEEDEEDVGRPDDRRPDMLPTDSEADVGAYEGTGVARRM